MVILGFRRYIWRKKYLVLHDLKFTPLIIDGSTIAFKLSQCPDVDLKFGGDYNTMYDRIYEFFDRLQKAYVTPIVIMDGSFKEQKELNMNRRENEHFKSLLPYNQNYQKNSIQFFYLLKTEVFINVLKDLNIIVYRADSESDEEIIALAGALKCSVLSNNFDFCLRGELTSLIWDEASLEGKFLRFDMEKFLNDHKISVSVLPLVPVLANDDHFQMKAIDAVLGRPIDPYNRCEETLKWLQNKDFDSAKKEIILALEKIHSDIESKIDFVVESYNKPKTTFNSILSANPLIFEFIKRFRPNVVENVTIQEFEVPEYITKMVRECRLPSLMLNIDTENENWYSMHPPSERLIQGIYSLLLSYRTEKHPTALKMRKNVTILDQKAEIPCQENFDLLLKILEIEESSHEILKFFDHDWLIFVLAFVYWRKIMRPNIRPIHYHSLLLTAFSLNLIKKDLRFAPKETISNYFLNLKSSDVRFYKTKIPEVTIKKINEEDSSDIFHIHMYISFQRCLYYVMHIVKLLNLPYEINISDFLNGGFFHSFFTKLQTKSNCFEFITEWFEKVKSFKNLYRLILLKVDTI